MTNLDPTAPSAPLAPVDAPPPPPAPAKPAGPTNPLNPLLLPNVAVLGSFALALAAMIVMCILAIIYDGSYAQALLQICQTIVYAGMGVGGATTIVHSFRSQQ